MHTKDLVNSGPAVNHVIRVQLPLNISEKCANVDIEVASNGSHTAAEKGNTSRVINLV